jgi:hypothetical protein
MSFRHFFKRPTSISHKILAAIFLISSIVTLAITLIQLSFDYYQEMNALEKNMAIIKKSYVQSISVSMWNMQSSQLKTALDGIVNIPGIQYAAILDKEKVYVESGTIAKNKTMKKVLN